MLSKPAIAAVRALRERGLRLNSIHTGLQRGQIGPAASVKRQLAHRSRIHDRVDVRGGQLHGGSFSADFNLLGDRSDLHGQIEGQRRAYRELDFFSEFGLKSLRGKFHVISTRQQVGSCIEALIVAGSGSNHTRCHVRDRNVSIRDHSTTTVSDRSGDCPTGYLSQEFAC